MNDYITNDNVNHELFDVNSKLSSIGLGFQMGFQWLIKDRIAVDWYFFGAGAERVNFNASYVTETGKSFNYSYIKGDVDDFFTDINIFKKKYVSEVRPERLKIELPVWMPGIKTGFSIGYAF